jgi:transglutaminase-like putative cysteine protease
VTRFGLVPFSLFVVVIATTAIGLAAHGRRTTGAVAVPDSRSRTFEFTYQAHFPATSGVTGPVHLWVPYPTKLDAYQTPATGVSLTETVPHAIGHDPEYGDEFIVFNPRPEQVAAGFDAGVRFTVTRKEYVALRDGAAVQRAPYVAPSAAVLQRYLEPDKLVPLNGVIADLARQKTAGANTSLEKARKIYDYVVSTMHYDKSGEGWGRGDAIWACDSKRGNCTDFHSVFIGMMRSSGIPARFEIGFPLPESKSEGEISGYHCWSEFYIAGIGWIPVDASEASKNPAKKDYFFGALDVNRVLFTYGRDVRLSADQKGDPLNYFIYPYAEINGQPVKDLKRSFFFRDVSASRQTAAGR